MIKLTREDIHILSRHSNLEEASIKQLLESQVYHQEKAWYHFLRLFLAGLGTGFLVVGITFFFAYNWEDMHKFIKFALVEVALVLVVVLAVSLKVNNTLRNILLTGAAMLVGVLFAVMGQVYQTGANAYDFFLAWTVFIFVWVLVADFAVLWLFFLVLLNTTFVLYTQQVALGWSELWEATVLFLLNVAFLLGALLLPHIRKDITVPVWWSNIVTLAAVFFATIGITIGIFSNQIPTAFWVLLVLVLVFYSQGIHFGLRQKNSFYLATIAFSVIFIISAMLVETSQGGFEMFFLVSLFIVISTTLTVKFLITLQKKWSNEK